MATVKRKTIRSIKRPCSGLKRAAIAKRAIVGKNTANASMQALNARICANAKIVIICFFINRLKWKMQ